MFDGNLDKKAIVWSCKVKAPSTSREPYTTFMMILSVLSLLAVEESKHNVRS